MGLKSRLKLITVISAIGGPKINEQVIRNNKWDQGKVRQVRKKEKNAKTYKSIKQIKQPEKTEKI